MALKATIHKATLQVADMDRQHYGNHALILARHPSETDERMMMRLLVFALHAHEHLALGKGLSDPDEPDLWRRDLTGAVEQWIELGQPDDKRILKACGRAQQVFVYAYAAASTVWWQAAGGRLSRARNLSVRQLSVTGDDPLAKLAQRNMQLQCTIQDQEIWISDAQRSVQVTCTSLRG